MDKEEIKKELTDIFKNTFNDDSIELFDEMTAKDVDDWDSLTHAIMIAEVEKHFSVKFKIREIIKLNNVGALIDTLEKKLA